MRSRLQIISSMVVLMLIFGINQNSLAQSSIFNFSYNIGIPTTDYINKASFRGFGFDGRGFVSDNVSVGGMFSMAVFAEQVDALESTEIFDASGLQNRYINAFPLAVNSHYYFGEAYGTRFYIGLGAGAYRINNRTEFGIYAYENNNWHFGLYPEAGVVVPVGTGSTALFFALKYQNAFANSKADSFSWLSIDIGLSIVN